MYRRRMQERVQERRLYGKKMQEEKHVEDCTASPDVQDHCVKDVVKRIIEAQDKAVDDCTVNCENSIQQLLSNKDKTEYEPSHTTIPFILFCTHTCEPFIGGGVFQSPPDNQDCTFFGAVESPVFRAKHFVKDSDDCVNLELLLPVTEDCDIPSTALKPHHGLGSFFPKDEPVTDFLATGICLTVDLNSFNAFTCLDATTPIPSSEFPPLN